MIQQRLFTSFLQCSLAMINLKLSDFLRVPDTNTVFGGKNGGEGCFFVYFGLASSCGGSEWVFPS